MNYYIDFDSTIYSTSNLKGDMLKSIAETCTKVNNKLNYETILFDCTQTFCREKIYNIYRLCEYIGKKYVVDENALIKEINNILINGEKYVYDDVEYFLTSLREAGERLILLTYTDEDSLEYQKKKIEGANIKHFFDDIIYTTTKKYELNLDYTNSVFIDDNPNQLIGIYEKHPKAIIRIKRDDCKYSKINIEKRGIIEIKNFKEIGINLQKTAKKC